MTPNELLLWLSARKEGSWRQFRAAVETLDLANSADETEQNASLPLHLRVHFNLERLGHLEFGAAECEKGWRVVPPALALSQHNGHVIGVLCGARTPKLLERIEQAANGSPLERTSYTDCPDVLRLQAPDAETLIVLAGRAGILCQIDAPESLLSRLPSIASLNGFRREALPAFGGREWEVQQFVIDRKVMKWRTITLQEANASGAQELFRFTHFQMPRYFLREGRETIALPDAIGKYYILFRRQRRVLKYDRKERSLTLPAIFRPPLLTERALILCSGFPPSIGVARGRPTLTYRDIPEEVVGMTAEVLRQVLL
jgi:hypothetical protein